MNPLIVVSKRMPYAWMCLILVCAPICPTPPWLNYAAAAEDTVYGAERREGRGYIERVDDVWIRDPTTPTGERLAEIRLPMEWVPAGVFLMGSPDGEPGRERTEGPRHRVQLNAFWMSRFEFTWEVFEAWQRSSANDRSAAKHAMSDARKAAAQLPGPPRPYSDPDFNEDRVNRDHIPATGITALGAQEFCRWLTLRSGRLYRLPTEAEWEYAARAESETAWSFGNTPDRLSQFAWYGRPLKEGAHEVGKLRPNVWGIYDMHGNVAEWVLDMWTDGYLGDARKENVNPWVPRGRSGVGVARGGDWTSVADATRSAARRKVDCRPRVIEENPAWFDLSNDGRRIGFRFVSPVGREGDSKEDSIRMPLEQRGRDPGER
jgi:formylglycine-generating enzyme required for sulfatase activity